MLICRCAASKAFWIVSVMGGLFAGVGRFSPQLAYAQAPSPSFVYSSYLGGRDYDSAEAVAVDAHGYIYTTGETHSRNFPVVNAHQTECRLGSLGSCTEAFVTKLKPDGSGVVYSTYFGGTSNDKGYGIAADAQGNAYVTGAMDNAAFVAKFDAEGRLVYQRTFSGYPITIGRAIAVDAAGNAYITGQTLSREFPVQKALQPNPGGVSCYAIGG
ncbi:MAG TPA: SBBP repeat-containing protein, partial [Terriglobia bacterium]|nr:SBBP repeat-containing protein [Terriglobia bacterium]